MMTGSTSGVALASGTLVSPNCPFGRPTAMTQQSERNANGCRGCRRARRVFTIRRRLLGMRPINVARCPSVFYPIYHFPQSVALIIIY